MFVLYDLLLLILFSILFIGLHFFIERAKTFKVLRRVFVGNVFTNLIEGLLYAFVAFSLDVLMQYIYGDIGIAFYYIVFIVLISVKGMRVASYSLLPSMVFMLITDDINIDHFMLMGEFFVFSILIILMKFFVSKINIKLIIYPVMITISFIVFLVSFFYFNRTSEKNIGFILFTVIGSIFVELIFSYAMKTARSADVLYKSVNFDYSTFYRASFVQEVIGTSIKENKTEKGIYGMFKITFVGKHNKDIEKELLEAALDNIKEAFPEKTILFHVQLDEYGFFLPWQENIDMENIIKSNTQTKRLKSDSLNYLSMFLENSSKKMKITTKQAISIDVSASISIYGVQTSSLSRLHKNVSFAINYLHSYENKYNIFDSGEYKRRMRDMKELRELEDLINLNEIEMNEINIYNNKAEKVAIFIEATHNSDEDYVGSLLEYVASAEMLNTFNRYVSAEYLKQMKVSEVPIAIPYSWKYIGEDFDIIAFENRFKVLSIDPSNIILNFHAKWIDGNETNIKNITALKTIGFSISITNPFDEKLKLIKKLKPKYIFSTKVADVKMKVCKNICNIRIKNEDDIIIAGRNQFNCFGGEFSKNDIDKKLINNNIIDAIKKIKEVDND